MKQTAVEWLEKEFVKLEYSIGVHSAMYELINKSKEMEKEQIIDSFHEGWLQCNIYGLPEKSRKHFETAEQYYNETFKK